MKISTPPAMVRGRRLNELVDFVICELAAKEVDQLLSTRQHTEGPTKWEVW